MIRRPPRSTQSRSSAASDVYKRQGKALVKSLEGHVAPHYSSFRTNQGDQDRADAWIRDFDSLVAVQAVPQLSIMVLPNDHTFGQKIGMVTPTASVGDNDLALGRILDHLSHSP